MPYMTFQDNMGDGAGEPRSDLQELQFKANQVTDETLESTRRMLSLCEEVRLYTPFLL